jgi:hypothetical protein
MGIVTANNGIGKIEILELSLQLAFVLPGHFPTKDESNFLSWAVRWFVHVEQALGELVDGGAAEEDRVVAKLDLGKEEPVLAAGLSSFLGGEERGESCQPLLPTAQ